MANSRTSGQRKPAALVRTSELSSRRQNDYDFAAQFDTEAKVRNLLGVKPLFSWMASGYSGMTCEYPFKLADADVKKLAQLERQMQAVIDAATVVPRPDVLKSQRLAIAAAKDAPLQRLLREQSP